MEENKKIKNATKNYDKNSGIIFKSILEKTCFNLLKTEGFDPQYEQKKFVLSEGFRPTVPYYAKDNTTKLLTLSKKKLVDVTYTPDITFNYNGVLIIIEIKGMANDIYPLKRKLFRKFLENYEQKAAFYEVHSIRELKEAIEIIKKGSGYEES